VAVKKLIDSAAHGVQAQIPIYILLKNNLSFL